MDRLNQILEQANKSKQQATSSIPKMDQTTFQNPLQKQMKKYFMENRIPRYFMYAIIAVKITTIYDKIK